MGLRNVITPTESTTIMVPAKSEMVKKNFYMDMIASKYTGKNPFKRWWSRKMFIHKCREIQSRSPSFGELWYFSEFIKTAERVYFLNNCQKGIIFSSKSYKAGENGFIIDATEKLSVRIVVKLYSDDSKVIMDIIRTNGSNMSTEHIFINNDWTSDKKEYDELLIDNAIGIINAHIIKLLQYCWDRVGSYDNMDIIL